MRLKEFKGPEKKGINWDRLIKDNPILKDILKKIPPGNVAKLLNPNKVMQLITTIFSSGELNKGEQAELDRIKDLAKSYADLEDAFGTEVAPKTLPKRSPTKIEPGDTPLPQRQPTPTPTPGKIDVPEPDIPQVKPQPLIKPGKVPTRSPIKIEPGDAPLPQRQADLKRGKIDILEPVVPKVKLEPLIKPGKVPTRSSTKIEPGQAQIAQRQADPKRGKINVPVPVVPDVTTKTPTTPVRKQNIPLLRQQIKNFIHSPSGQTVLQYEDAQLNEKTYTKAQYADLVRKYSKAYNVPPALAMHVLNRETGIYDPNKAASIISRAGAVGPMQLMPQYSKDFGIRQQDLTDPTKNIEAGVRNLAKQFERFKGNPQHALMAYNWGPTATANWLAKGGKDKIPQETYDYIYGSKDKNWAPYSNDIEQQITTYLGPDDAQPYLTKMNTNNTSILQKKYNDFTNKLSSLKTDAMATGSGTDTAAIAGAGNTGELPNITSPSTPAPRPQIQGGPIWDKAKELGTAALDKVRDLNKSTSIQDTIKQKYNNFVEPVKEKAPPGDKYERMIKDIKKGYAKDGKLTNTERSIAYATAWKLYNKRKGKKS